jgi:hypothetical protein
MRKIKNEYVYALVTYNFKFSQIISVLTFGIVGLLTISKT